MTFFKSTREHRLFQTRGQSFRERKPGGTDKKQTRNKQKQRETRRKKQEENNKSNLTFK